MTTSTVDMTEMSREYERWETDHANWLRGAYRRQTEDESALTELQHLEAIITNFVEKVRHHAVRIVAREKTLVHLARVMREVRFTDDLNDLVKPCRRHEAVVQAKTDDALARLKERHEAVMDQLHVLSRIAEQEI